MLVFSQLVSGRFVRGAHAVVDALMLIVDVAMVDALSHVIGHYNGCNLAAELLVEIISLCFWFMRPTPRQAGGTSL